MANHQERHLRERYPLLTRDRLASYFEMVDAPKAKRVDALLKAYVGRNGRLCELLEKRYALHPVNAEIRMPNQELLRIEANMKVMRDAGFLVPEPEVDADGKKPEVAQWSRAQLIERHRELHSAAMAAKIEPAGD